MRPNPKPVESITVRAAEPFDRMSLATLAQLEGAAPVFDAVLVAELDGSVVAALTTDGNVLADPFRHTEGIVEFMRSETAARLFGPVEPLRRSRALDTRYEPRPRPRRSRRYWRTNPATNAGL